MARNEGSTYHATDAPYVLPNDASEHERLELQTDAINRMMHNQPLHAPVQVPRRILEVGCGTGNMTAYLAETHPSSEEVIGIDLSPVPPRASPASVTFIEGDFRHLAADPDHSHLGSNSFDYVFSRMLVFGMTDWRIYVAQMRDLLKQGGWIELQDLDFHYYDMNEQRICGSWKWLRDQTAAFGERGLDVRIGSKLEQYLREAGFVDIHVKKFRWVFGRWEGHPETDMIGAYSTKYLVPVNLRAYKMVLGPSKSLEELEADEAEMKDSLAFTNEGKHQRFYVVIGRKP